jgi:hypothetical protein
MSTICSIFLNRTNSAIKIDKFVKTRIHQVFSVLYLVFRLTHMMLFKIVNLSKLNTKHLYKIEKRPDQHPKN